MPMTTVTSKSAQAPNLARAEELLDFLRAVAQGAHEASPRQINQAMEELRRYLPEDVSDAVIEPEE